MKWEMVKLGDIINIKSGGTPSRKKIEYFKEGTIPWVKTGDLKNREIFEASEYITELGLLNSSAKLFPKNTLLVAMYGATIGACSILRIEASTNQACAALFPNSKISVDYLYYYFKYIKPHLIRIGVGGAQPNISAAIIKQLKIPLPPLTEQKRIAQLLDTADALRQKDKALLESYDELLESVFLEMFGDAMTNEKGWRVKQLDFFGKIVTGNTPSTKNDSYYGDYIEWIKSDNINTPHKYLTKAEKYLSQKGSKIGRIVPKKSLLVICIAGSLSSLGKVAIADREVAFNQQINAIIPNTEIVNVDFLYVQFLMSQLKIQDASTKSMKGMISKSKFSKIEFIYPPISLQNKFAEIVQNIEAQKERVRKQLKESEDLFGALMQEVFG